MAAYGKTLFLHHCEGKDVDGRRTAWCKRYWGGGPYATTGEGEGSKFFGSEKKKRKKIVAKHHLP